jgi:ring-1,2-phenylacetyl-CoA epoxidase subunit PaaC
MNPLAGMQDARISFLLYLADTSLILGQRNSEWCGHGPILEQDIALTNISLDLIGQARSLYQYAARLIGDTDEDKLFAFRNEREYRNLLLAEQPNGDWGNTILRQYLFSEFQLLLFQELKKSDDIDLAAIAEKSVKETMYHRRWSSEWVVRLGNGTEESHARMKKALENLWPYTGEMFQPAAYEKVFALDSASIHAAWTSAVKVVLEEATLPYPENVFMHTGGKSGVHTEQLGYILTDLQYLQRTYPGAEW